jgi:hypothetical protein
MAISEHGRFELHQALERAIGVEQAATLMEHLPPVGWADVATKRDLDHLATATTRDLDQLGTVLRSEIAALGSDLRIEMSGLRADVHSAITTSISLQTRTLMFALIGTQFTLAALAFGAARLGG